jgi:hypothetical protein
MSAAMIKAHGGSKVIQSDKGGGIDTGGLIHDTKAGMPKDVHMKGLDRLISQTTGIVREKPIMSGVLTNTTGPRKDVPELHKVAKDQVGKTVSKMAVGGPYSGPKSGYGKA